MMSDFKWFQKCVRNKGGIWASEDVYFTQTRDRYIAAYLPEYPNRTDNDQEIVYNHSEDIDDYV